MYISFYFSKDLSFFLFFFKQKTAYEMRISDWSSDVCSSDLRAVINWQSFSIGEGSRVDIRQPDARSALLNRVTGDTTSTIAGSLNANGQVFLINPNGIQITATGTVRAAGFVASTLDIGDRSEEPKSELQALKRSP